MAPRFSAFVASTEEELRGHRARVVAALRDSGLTVREDVASASLGESSIEIIGRADLVIFLIAFRIGPFIEREYEATREMGKDVLVFLLDEEAPWPRRYDELDSDPSVRPFRDAVVELLEDHVVGWFGLEPESVQIEPAIREWLDARRGTDVTEGAKSIVRRIEASVSMDELVRTLRDVERSAGELVEEAPELVPVMLRAYRSALDWSGLVSFVERLDPSVLDDPAIAGEYSIALVRSGDAVRAVEFTASALESSPHNGELLGTRAQALDARWRATRDPDDLDGAISAYRSLFDLEHDAFAAARAVRLMTIRGDDRADVRSLASRGEKALHPAESEFRDFWWWATALELSLVLEDWDSARSHAYGMLAGRSDQWSRDAVRKDIESLLISIAAPLDVASEFESIFAEAS